MNEKKWVPVYEGKDVQLLSNWRTMPREFFLHYSTDVQKSVLQTRRQKRNKTKTDDLSLRGHNVGLKEGHQRSYRFWLTPLPPPPTMSRSKHTHTGISAERFLRACSSSVAQEGLENTASTCLPHHKQTVPHSWHNLWCFHSSGAEPESGIWHPIFWRAQPLLEKQTKCKVSRGKQHFHGRARKWCMHLNSHD